jgi:hypothetical protein
MSTLFESSFFPPDESGLQLLALIAACALPILSVLGFSAAIWAVHVNRRVQREQTAKNVYIRYQELAFANPWLSCPRDIDIQELDQRRFGSEPGDKPGDREERFERYEWFLSILTRTADYVWTSVKPRHVLCMLIELQIAYHWRYFQLYKEKKEYLVLWRRVHGEKIDRGIKLGRRYDSEKRRDWK